MTAPHIRDLNLPDWHEVPEGATIPAGTRYVCTFPSGRWFVETGSVALPPSDRNPDCRLFTADPIPDPREEEIEAEAARLYRLAYPALCDTWGRLPAGVVRDGFRRLAAESLDRQATRE